MPKVLQKFAHPLMCPVCRHSFDQDITLICPNCGFQSQYCPDTMCHNDLFSPKACNPCFKLRQSAPPVSATQPPPRKKGSWGGRRAGAGAPKGSLNHLKTGSRSALIRRAVEVLAENKELRPFLLLIARAAVEDEIPQTTRRLILHSLGEKTAGMEAAAVQLRRLRNA